MQYLVCFLCFDYNIFPKPNENSLTLTLKNFATKKCPASCINIKKPNKNMILIAFIIKEINISSCLQHKYTN